MKQTLLITAVLAAFCAGAYAAPSEPARRAQMRYDVSREKSCTGKLLRIKEMPLAGSGTDITDYVFLLLSTADGRTLECALGPAWKIAGFVDFKKDDIITVTGAMTDCSQLLVRVAKSKTGTLTMRDARGKGVWDTSPESFSDSHMGRPAGGRGGPSGGPGGGMPEGR